MVPDVGKLLDNVPAIEPTLLTDRVIWPNEVRHALRTLCHTSTGSRQPS